MSAPYRGAGLGHKRGCVLLYPPLLFYTIFTGNGCGNLLRLLECLPHIGALVQGRNEVVSSCVLHYYFTLYSQEMGVVTC